MMIIFAIVYVIVGTMAVMGVVNGIMPGHEKEETMVIILAYAVALLALITGVVCIKGMAGASKFFGGIVAVLGLASLIYQQIAHDSFSTYDSLAMCFGAAIFSIAGKMNGEK